MNFFFKITLNQHEYKDYVDMNLARVLNYTLFLLYHLMALTYLTPALNYVKGLTDV